MGIIALLKKIGDIMLGEFKTSLIDRLARVETKLDRVENDLETIKKDVTDIAARTGRLEPTTHEIQAVLKSIGAPLHQPPLLIAPGSPLKLTPAGAELASKIDGYNFIEVNKEFFVNLIRQLNPMSEYDAQEFAKRVLAESSTHPILNPIKQFAYENGISLDMLLSVLSIILRDKFLAEHPIKTDRT